MEHRAAAPRDARWRRAAARRSAALARIIRERVVARLDRRRIVFRWDEGRAPATSSPLAPLQVHSLAELPQSVFGEQASGGQSREWYAHFFGQGATLWTALEQGRALGSLWIVPAARLGPWYIPLEPDAQLIYGVVTPARGRGRGVAAQLALAAARAAQAPVYLDCMIWNRSAHRAFAKAGFAPVAVVGSRFREVRFQHGE